MKRSPILIASMALLLTATASAAGPARAELALTRADYTDRVRAIWTGQIIAVLVLLEFEHKTASVLPIKSCPMTWEGKLATFAPVDDEANALRHASLHSLHRGG